VEILIPINSKDSARETIEYTIRAYPNASITVLHILPPSSSYAVEGVPFQNSLVESKRRYPDELFEVATETAERLGGSITKVTAIGSPVRKIVEYADKPNIDHIVIGSCGRSGLLRFLFQNVTTAVVSRSPVPVTVVK
jgi:nucleotide-binding universal stress UspA family protein